MGLDTVNHVASVTDGTTRTVALDTLDDACGNERPSLIKLDVEGFESEVLGGAAATLGCPELKAIITEDRSPPVVEVLHDSGFVEYTYDPFLRTLRRSQGAVSAIMRSLCATRHLWNTGCKAPLASASWISCFDRCRQIGSLCRRPACYRARHAKLGVPAPPAGGSWRCASIRLAIGGVEIFVQADDADRPVLVAKRD